MYKKEVLKEEKRRRKKTIKILFSLVLSCLARSQRKFKIPKANNNEINFQASISEDEDTLSFIMSLKGSISLGVYAAKKKFTRPRNSREIESKLVFSTICPRSSDPFYIVNQCIQWVNTSWTHSSSSLYSGLVLNGVNFLLLFI